MNTAPPWLRNRCSKTTILKSILSDINGMMYYEDISKIISGTTFATRVNYPTKASMTIFLFLRSKSVPVLIEDVLIYCNTNKLAFISLLAKNRGIIPDSGVSLDYVINVLDRIYTTFRHHITLEYDIIKEKVATVFNTNYYYSKSPLISIVVLCFYKNTKKIPSIVKDHYTTVTLYRINKEIAKILKILKKEPISSAESFVIAEPENKKANNQLKEISQNRRKCLSEMTKQLEKELKVDRAIQLYKDGVGESTSHCIDYEGLLIEGMVKQGYTKEMIMNLSYKGLEYYSPYK